MEGGPAEEARDKIGPNGTAQGPTSPARPSHLPINPLVMAPSTDEATDEGRVVIPVTPPAAKHALNQTLTKAPTSKLLHASVPLWT